MAADKVATFAINLDGNVKDAAKEGAEGLEALRKQVEASQQSIREMVAAQKSLRGSSDEVSAARELLKAKIVAERGVVSQLNLELLKQGTTYEHLAAQARKKKDADDSVGKGIKAVGGPVSELTDKFEGLKGMLAESDIAMLGVGAAAAGAVVGVIALTAAIADGAKKVSEFTLSSANHLRALELQREAAAGSEKDAKALGEQVERLGEKVSTSRDKLNELAVSLTKSLSGGFSKASGQAIVDTFAAVSQAADAMGDDVGNSLKGIVERGKMMGRVRINPFELQGTGLQFEKIAGALAKNLNIGVDQAKKALFEGRVTLDDGAKALRDAVEERFGQINAKKLLDLDVLSSKLHEKWVGLTKDVNLQPIAEAFQKIIGLFDEGTVTGEELKHIFRDIGDALGVGAKAGVPIAQELVDDLIIGAQDIEIAFLETRNSIRKTFGTADEGKALKDTLSTLGDGAIVLAKGLLKSAEAAAWLLASLDKLESILGENKKRMNVGGVDLGNNLVEGLVNSMTGGGYDVARAGVQLGMKAMDAFKKTLGISSPSKVFEGYGKDVAAGAAAGMDKGAPDVQRSAEGMAPAPPTAPRERSAGAGLGASAGPVNLEVNIHVDGSAKGHDAAEKLSAPEFLGHLTKAVRQALVTAGIPTQGAAP